MAGQAGTAILTLAAIRVITGVLSPEVFGMAVLFLAVLSLAKGLFVAPILAGVLRYDPRAVAQKTACDLYLAVGRLGALALLAAGVASVSLAVLFGLRAPGLGLAWLVLAFAFWLSVDALMSLCLAVLNARRLQGNLALLRIADSFARPTAAIILVVSVSSSALLYVAGRTAGAALLLLGIGVVLLPNVKRSRLLLNCSTHSVRAEWRTRLLQYGWPLIPVSILHWTIHLADRFLLNGFHDSATVGVYAASYALASQPFIMLSAALTMVLRPHMFEAADRSGESDEAVLLLRREWLKWLAVLGSGGIVLMVLLRQQIGILFLAPSYRGEAWLLVIIGGAYLLLAVGQLAENYLLACERTRSVLQVSAWSTVVTLLGAVALIPRYAAYGAAWSTVVGLGTYAGLMWRAQTSKAN